MQKTLFADDIKLIDLVDFIIDNNDELSETLDYHFVEEAAGEHLILAENILIKIPDLGLDLRSGNYMVWSNTRKYEEDHTVTIIYGDDEEPINYLYHSDEGYLEALKEYLESRGANMEIDDIMCKIYVSVVDDAEYQ